MIFSLRIDEAVAQLRRAYPAASPAISDFKVEAPTDYPDDEAHGYSAIQSAYIEPIAQAYVLCLRIGTAIANHFGAHG
jgi:phosphoenolpyruvate carboxylase